ncbi:MAG: hypothetical protein ACRD40_18145 [Candidatus Acidiferrales bacterium]
MSAANNSGHKGGVAMAWSGEDPVAYTHAVAALEAAGIRKFDIAENDQFMGVPQISGPRYRVLVAKSDAIRAEEAIIEALSAFARQEPIPPERVYNPLEHPLIQRHSSSKFSQGTLLPSDGGEFGEKALDNYPEKFDPSEAVVTVWSGEDAQMGKVFQECLANLGIGCVLKEDTGKARVLVTPNAEKRAREVVREIEEGTPMQ